MQYINFTGTKYSLTGMISSVKKGKEKTFYKVNEFMASTNIRKIQWTGQSFVYDGDSEWLNLSPSVLNATYYENKPIITSLKEVEYKDVCEVLSWGQGAFYKHKETGQVEQVQIVGDQTMNTYVRYMAIYKSNAAAWYI